MDRIGRMVLLVDNYDEALKFYTEVLDFAVLVDSAEPRYVHIYLPRQPDFGLWLLEPSGEEQRRNVGRQTAGQPCAVFYTDDLMADFQRLREKGVTFNRLPKEEGGARFAHFLDLYGNEFVLVELLSA